MTEPTAITSQAETSAVCTQSQPNDGAAVQHVCLECNAKIHHKACAISYAACVNYVHLGCLIDLYKGSSTNILALKNSHEWLRGFLSFSGLCYACKSCKAANKVGNAQKSFAGNSDVEIMPQVKNIIENVNKNLTDLITGQVHWRNQGS